MFDVTAATLHHEGTGLRTLRDSVTVGKKRATTAGQKLQCLLVALSPRTEEPQNRPCPAVNNGQR